LSALVMLGFAGAALAADPIPLAPVDVPAPDADQPSAASPSRRDPSGATTTVEAKEHVGEAKDTAALLAPTPGATVSSSGGSGQAESISVRGASSSGVLVLLDGVPLGGPGQSVDLSTIPAAAVERLEVLRSGGARYGPGALGGVVNVVTLKPQSGARLFAEGTEGSFDTTLLSAGATGSLLGGQALLALNGLRSLGNFTYSYTPLTELPGAMAQQLTRVNNDALQGGALLRYRADLPRGFVVDAFLDATAYDRGLAGTVENPTPDARENGLRTAFAARLAKRFDSGGALEALAWGRANRTHLSGGNFGDLFQADSGAGAEAVYTHLIGRHGLTGLLSAGSEWLVTPGGPNPSWGRFSAMAQDEVLFLDGDLSVSGSVRVDQSGPFTGFSPKLGGLWLLPKGFEVKANVGQAHRPPSFFELYVTQGHLLPNPMLQPERALYVDGAAAYRHALGLLQVGGFYAIYENLISYEYYPPMLARPYNFAAARVAGLEAEGRFTPFSWLSLSASYTFMQTQNLKDDPRYYLKALPYRPEHKLHARVAVGPRWLYARGEVLYQSQQFLNRTETLALPGRAIVSAGASCELMKAPVLSLSFEVKNVLDVQSSDLDGYPLPPRAAYLTLGITWDAVPERKS
jgi:iron complex outermembrane receptor protein